MACGGPPSQGRLGSPAPVAATATFPASTTSSVIPPGQRLRGDGDADNPKDIDGNGDSDSAAVGGPDEDSDSPTRASYDFPDGDDATVLGHGHRPSATVSRSIASVVRRYYAAASQGDGRTACSLLMPGLARSAAADYGGGGAAYLRGGKTCKGVLALLFAHLQDQLSEAGTVVRERVEGDRGQVVVGSRKMPASVVPVVRTRGAWGISALIGEPLP